MVKLKVTFRVVSPLYLGGADQQAEIRAASFKGVLRSWYRAADPEFRGRESRLFGGTGRNEGQSRVLLRTHADPFKPYEWDREGARQYSEGRGQQTRNGLIYFGWPFQFGRGPIRTAVPPGTRISLRCVVPRSLLVDERRGLLAALWLLGRLGSLGTRAGRGFGSLTLLDWSCEPREDEWQQELDRLPIGLPADSAAWTSGLEQGLTVIQDEWLGRWRREARHPHLGRRFRHVLSERGWQGDNAWIQALNHAGLALQEFRQRREPDYRRVRDYLQTDRIELGPERAAFGLPLAFQFGSLSKPHNRVEFVPVGDRRTYGDKPLDRHASLVRIRLVELRDGLRPLFFRLDGDAPGQSPPVGIRGKGRPLVPASDAILDRFFDHLEGR
ncbi:MAG TPA: RAMP superfamily CRISPR-associated protein [Vicinamibacteria bacterium]|jgi:CRISPR-associated protein Cmr1